MKQLQVSLLSSSALAALSALPAFGQSAPVYNWTGPYVGVHGGGIAHQNRATDLNNFFSFPGATYGLNTTGIMGGVQAGYNWQSGSFVYGAEIDASFAAVSASRTFVTPNNGPALHKTSLDGLATARLRAGFAFDHFMIYGTAGFAAAQIQNHMSSIPFAPAAVWSNTSWRTGWVIGVGGEYAISNSWRVKAELLYADFGRQTLNSAGIVAGGPYRFSFRNTATIGRIGLNYAF